MHSNAAFKIVEEEFFVCKMSEASSDARNVLVAVDGSVHSERAFKCKL